MNTHKPLTQSTVLVVENQHKILLDSCRKADDREEEPVCVEILKHSLDRLTVDPEGHAGSAQIQTAADHVVRVQLVLVDGGHGPRDSTWTGIGRRKCL